MIKTEVKHESGVSFLFEEDTTTISVLASDRNGNLRKDVYRVIALDTIQSIEQAEPYQISDDPVICQWFLAKFFSHLANRGYTKIHPVHRQGEVHITPQRDDRLNVHIKTTDPQAEPVNLVFNVPWHRN